MKKELLILLVGSVLALPAYAASEEKVLPAAKNITRLMPHHCMQETVSLSVNFNIKAKSFTDAKAKFDDKMKQIADFAKQQQVDKFEPQSMNYNINPQQVGYEDGVPVIGGYQLSGNASYQLKSADVAFKLGEFLTQQKFQVSINVNKYNNGACTNESIIGE
jgi:uncharacterized protein YggE